MDDIIIVLDNLRPKNKGVWPRQNEAKRTPAASLRRLEVEFTPLDSI
jgi:hypothetical protein